MGFIQFVLLERGLDGEDYMCAVAHLGGDGLNQRVQLRVDAIVVLEVLFGRAVGDGVDDRVVEPADDGDSACAGGVFIRKQAGEIGETEVVHGRIESPFEEAPSGLFHVLYFPPIVYSCEYYCRALNSTDVISSIRNP